MSEWGTQFATEPRLPELAALLRRPPRFNILSALGLSRQELRHSALLAYLLDPREPHGLGDSFARALLGQVAPLLPESLDVPALSLAGMTVQREWNYIDVLLEAPTDRLAVIIENKVDSDEHSGQLSRYERLVRKHRPGWRVIGIYLTLDGAPPAQERDRMVDPLSSTVAGSVFRMAPPSADVKRLTHIASPSGVMRCRRQPPTGRGVVRVKGFSRVAAP